MPTSTDNNSVSTTLSLLQQTLSDEKQRLNDEVAEAMQDGKFDTATAVIQFAQRLVGFQEEVEALVEKWEELEEFRDAATSQVQQIVRGRTIRSNRPAKASHVQWSQNEGRGDSTPFCIHILEVLVEMGGRATNQNVTTAVNKKIKMHYPKFRHARVLMAQRGWTKSNGSNHVLEISAAGLKWLHDQNRPMAVPSGKHDGNQRIRAEKAISPTEVEENGPFI